MGWHTLLIVNKFDSINQYTLYTSKSFVSKHWNITLLIVYTQNRLNKLKKTHTKNQQKKPQEKEIKKPKTNKQITDK